MVIPIFFVYLCCTLIADNKGMTKVVAKNSIRCADRAAKVKKAAELAGVSTSMGYKVLNGERRNEEFMTAYMMLNEGENLLLQEVKKVLEQI